MFNLAILHKDMRIENDQYYDNNGPGLMQIDTINWIIRNQSLGKQHHDNSLFSLVTGFNKRAQVLMSAGKHKSGL